MSDLDRSYPILTVPETVQSLKRSLIQKRLNLPMDSPDDIRLRLQRSIIFINGAAFYVEDVYSNGLAPWLLLRDNQSNTCRIRHTHPAIELRTPEAQYIQHQGQPYFFFRVPAREQKQGLVSANCRLKAPGTKNTCSFDDLYDFMRNLSKENTIPWTETFHGLFQNDILTSMKLSKSVAVYKSKKQPFDKIYTEFKGRTVGNLIEESVYLDGEDFDCPWIREALKQVNLKPKN